MKNCENERSGAKNVEMGGATTFLAMQHIFTRKFSRVLLIKKNPAIQEENCQISAIFLDFW